jgi:murein DD-endopeptidase MepM/ murein hydrolase activator NlpD
MVIVALLAVMVVPTTGVSGAAAADDGWLTDAERQASEQRQQRRAGLLGELDVLRASDVELQAESDRLAAAVVELEARMAATAVELETAQAKAGQLERELVVARRIFEARQRLAAERAVWAYMQPPMETMSAVLGAQDLTEAERRRVLADNVAANDRQVMAERQQAAADLEIAEDQFSANAAQIRMDLANQESDLEQLRAARQRAAEIAVALDGRIGAFQREADALAASEADLVSLISTRQAAAAAAATTTTTTVAPTTTTAAPSQPGGGNPSPPPPPPPPTSPPATSPPPASGGSLLWPTSGVVTSPFGWRWGSMHQGIDIGAGSGTPIYASESGTVFFSGWMGGYGNLILIDHGDGRVTAYAHQSGLAVSGGRVGRGQLIGYVGSTGDSTGPHLHFEVRVNGVAVNPMLHLA